MSQGCPFLMASFGYSNVNLLTLIYRNKPSEHQKSLTEKSLKRLVSPYNISSFIILQVQTDVPKATLIIHVTLEDAVK